MFRERERERELFYSICSDKNINRDFTIMENLDIDRIPGRPGQVNLKNMDIFSHYIFSLYYMF